MRRDAPDRQQRLRAFARVVALGRKSFLFAGTVEGGENLAVLYSLVASCEAASVAPQAYLADVVMRIQRRPQSRSDELLPHRWAALSG